MQLQIVIALVMCLTACFGYQDVVIDGNGQQYYLVPVNQAYQDHSRYRRQTKFGVGSNGVNLGHTGKIFDNDNHRLEGTAFANKDFANRGPLTTGGSLDYAHKPSGSGLSVGAQNTRGQGTDFSANGNYNFFNSKDGKTSAGISGEYNRRYGGPYGTGKPNYGAYLGLEHRF